MTPSSSLAAVAVAADGARDPPPPRTAMAGGFDDGGGGDVRPGLLYGAAFLRTCARAQAARPLGDGGSLHRRRLAVELLVGLADDLEALAGGVAREPQDDAPP